MNKDMRVRDSLYNQVSFIGNLKSATGQFLLVSDPSDTGLGSTKHSASHVHLLPIHGHDVCWRPTNLWRKCCREAMVRITLYAYNMATDTHHGATILCSLFDSRLKKSIYIFISLSVSFKHIC